MGLNPATTPFLALNENRHANYMTVVCCRFDQLVHLSEHSETL
jgi:hypothetical protein